MQKTKRKRRTIKIKNKRRFITAGSILLIILLALMAVVYEGVKVPDQVSGLAADTCYAGMRIHWGEVSRADGYHIRIVDSAGNEVVDEITDEGETTYTLTDYKHDQNYEVTVSAYKRGKIAGKVKEGKTSEPLIASYDSSKFAQKIPVLTYHKIVPTGTEFETGLLITEETFDQQMKYLHDNGFTTLTPEEFYEWHAGKKEFPVKTVMVTFDDGFYGTYHLAYPIIKKYGQAATVFCIGKNINNTTDPFDPTDRKDHYIGKDVIEMMREEYPRFTFESHTFDLHRRRKGKKPAESFTYEQFMEDCAKNEPYGFKYIAYPWGTYSETMQNAIRDSGYKMAFTYGPFYYSKRTDDTFAVNRIKINGTKPLEDFIKIVNGEMSKYDQ